MLVICYIHPSRPLTTGTYTGWVFGLLGGAASWTQGGKVPGAKDSEAPQMEVKVQQLK